MKKFLILFVVVLLLVGCSGRNDVIVIEEESFIAQVSELQMNPSEYVGRTVRYEGMFRTIYSFLTGEQQHQVIRYMFGCCGIDGVIGFEVYLGNIEPFSDYAWVEVIGVLELHELFLRIAATSVIELYERGAEVVWE